jgi:hypothetical protein
MRTKNVKTKLADEIVIPKRLVLFFHDVDLLIKQKDVSVTRSSDDLIQTQQQFVFGGLIEDGGDRFSFTYFPRNGSEATWEFELSAADIAAIAVGHKEALRLWRCSTRDCGYRFGSPNDICTDCDYIEDELEKEAEVSKARILKSMRGCASKQEWVKEH